MEDFFYPECLSQKRGYTLYTGAHYTWQIMITPLVIESSGILCFVTVLWYSFTSY